MSKSLIVYFSCNVCQKTKQCVQKDDIEKSL